MSAALSMGEDYPRQFEPAVLPNGMPNPRHCPPRPTCLAPAVRAVRGGRRNDVEVITSDVEPGACLRGRG
ncbi:MAG: hypothetical protein M3477_04640 [Gemmatimonadota bacterium]|nr:hypothetical protein [Gemmatimonadota bacterium]